MDRCQVVSERRFSQSCSLCRHLLTITTLSTHIAIGGNFARTHFFSIFLTTTQQFSLNILIQQPWFIFRASTSLLSSKHKTPSPWKSASALASSTTRLPNSQEDKDPCRKPFRQRSHPGSRRCQRPWSVHRVRRRSIYESHWRPISIRLLTPYQALKSLSQQGHHAPPRQASQCYD